MGEKRRKTETQIKEGLLVGKESTLPLSRANPGGGGGGEGGGNCEIWGVLPSDRYKKARESDRRTSM